MELPQQYKNLDANQKKVIVCNLISQFWNERSEEIANSLNEERVEFLFSYFFTESREERERIRDDMQKKYETAISDLKMIADKLQKLNLQFSEILIKNQDAEDFRSKFN